MEDLFSPGVGAAGPGSESDSAGEAPAAAAAALTDFAAVQRSCKLRPQLANNGRISLAQKRIWHNFFLVVLWNKQMHD